jgi:prepilin-type N-terminal cleavage/methylation domain-containing protein
MQMWARQIGITLIESLVVIAIIAILSGIAMSSFQWLRETAQQKRVIHQLQAAVLTARHRSIMKAAATYVCPSPAAVITAVSSMPECGDDYSSGVAIWTDQGGNWELQRLWQWPRVNITNKRGTQAVKAHIMFNARGLANRNITWSTCVDDRNLSLVLNRIGRPSVRRQWGDC